MINDLISRNEVMKLIESKFVDGCLEEGDKTLIDGCGLLDDVSDMPTAYDVDKVVESLEEDAKYFQSEADGLAQVGNWGTATELQGKAAAYRDAAKIVKSGGIE